MTDAVPYQAYRASPSKRHSQTLSVTLAQQPPQQHARSSSHSAIIPSSSHSPPSAASSSSSSPQRPASTFRRVPRRPPTSPSPLAPSTHSRNVSLLDSPSNRITSPSLALTPLPPPAPSPPPPVQPTQSTAPSSTPSTRPPSSNGPPAPQRAATSSTRPQSSNGAPAPQRAATSSPAPQRAQAPYRPGFQPKGLYRPLTDDFLALRRTKRDGDGADGQGPGTKRVERTKLLRRLEKLIDLHFPHDDAARPRPAPHGNANHRRASSFFDFDIRKINISDPGGLWRGVVGGGDANDVRAAEQRITPWQDDADVPKCPLCSYVPPHLLTLPPLTRPACSTSFHPLTNRKHHCRLCGQIICSLPVKHPHRPAPCSLLFVVDPKSRRIEEVDEGVDYGVRRKPVDGGIGNGNGNGDASSPRRAKGAPAAEEKFLKGVRICRSCRPILLRQQYQYEITHVPTFTKLYEALIALEQEIEESLPQFQELVLTLSHNDQPTKEASISRKRLLEAFAQYDALAKRIRRLPCPVGSSADQVQASIMNRASLFLQKNMFPLQSLPAPKKAAPKATQAPAPAPDAARQLDPDSEMALALQPLLEQEALLESFVEEAKAHRKFEDVKTLKANLREIRAEIDKMVVNAAGGMHA
ncbi:hypothetical protein DXG01_014512 [Tephrocybe rancida]|nr:hypothetical protein DXG01_014512 [Tephrocybe rancida]